MNALTNQERVMLALLGLLGLFVVGLAATYVGQYWKTRYTFSFDGPEFRNQLRISESARVRLVRHNSNQKSGNEQIWVLVHDENDFILIGANRPLRSTTKNTNTDPWQVPIVDFQFEGLLAPDNPYRKHFQERPSRTEIAKHISAVDQVYQRGKGQIRVWQLRS